MKFFTIVWWRGTQPNAEHGYVGDDPFQAYGEYVTTIQDRIPNSFLAMPSSVPLHDAKLLNLTHACHSQTLRIEFENLRVQSRKPGRFYLHYQEVSAFRSLADPYTGLSGPYGYGDLGYNEIDLTMDGQVEHRLLFSSGIELHIICQDVQYGWLQDENN